MPRLTSRLTGTYVKSLEAPLPKFWENVHPPWCVTCHVSRVTCHASGVRCHVPGVLCQIFFFFLSGASLCRVCYQQGLPRLVFIRTLKKDGVYSMSGISLFHESKWVGGQGWEACALSQLKTCTQIAQKVQLKKFSIKEAGKYYLTTKMEQVNSITIWPLYAQQNVNNILNSTKC